MLVDVHIRNNVDGETHIYKTSETTDLGVLDYGWSDGNYGCDCNRHLFFWRAVGQEPGDDMLCGDERYTVWITRQDTGELVYSDEEPLDYGAAGSPTSPKSPPSVDATQDP
jgi:hypothetical protein